jgi:predicted ATPase
MKAQELVNDDLCLGEEEVKVKTLSFQTEKWLGKILNPLKLEAKSLGKTNFLELLIGGFKPSNVGFGYSSILPIIVTGLIAKPNEKIIIENPEIHLHPKAQSALIEFLVKVANTGVQIFIESHSDHIINGILVQCKKFEESQNDGISKDDVTINYFAQDEEKKVKITKMNIEEGGRIRYTPKGFFDQFTIDRKFLMGF